MQLGHAFPLMDTAASFATRFHSNPPPQPWFRRAVVWGLVLALALYGYSGVLAGALGSLHRHAEPVVTLQERAAGDGAWSLLARLARTVQAWHETAQAQRHVLFVQDTEPGHHHHHGLFERHHHDVDDASVVALGAQESGSNAANEPPSTTTSCIGSLSMCPRSNLDVPVPSASHAPWPDSAADTWRSAELKLVERPPQA